MSLQEVAPVAPALRYPNLSHPKWTTDQLKTLAELHEQGLSATLKQRRINELYGTRYTRNAIIGATHRANLPKRISQVRAITRRRDCGSGSLQSILRRAITGTRELPPAPPAQVPFLGLTFMENTQCRFPRGGDNGEPILFCGQPTQEDSSYCPHCHSVTHRGGA